MMRICSFVPAATEILFSLGVGDQIVGVSHECDYPPEAKNKPIMVCSRLGPNRAPSAEVDRQVREAVASGRGLYTIDAAALKSAAPDIIVTQGLCDVCALDYGEVVKAAQSLPKPPAVVSLSAHSLTEVLDDVLRLGEATQRAGQATALAGLLQSRIVEVSRRATRPRKRPRVACLEWFEPLYVAGHWVPEMVELAGGRDALGDKGKASRIVRWEEVLDAAPEIIVLMPCGFDLARSVHEMDVLEKLAGWSELPAVRTGNVFAVDGNSYFSRPGPRLVDGLEFLAQLIHPEIFPRRAPLKAVKSIH
jgi:iron complex transport system substrate-binding protein